VTGPEIGGSQVESLTDEARDRHVRGIVRGEREFDRWGLYLAAPGVVLLIVAGKVQSWTAIALFGCGVAALAIAAAAMVPLARTLERHRAVLAEHGVFVSGKGEVRTPPRAAAGHRAGLDLASEARKALRTRRRVIVASTVLLTVFVAAFAAVVRGAIDEDWDNTVFAIAFCLLLLVALCLLAMSNTSLARVVDASGRRIAHHSITGYGHVIFFGACVAAGYVANRWYVAETLVASVVIALSVWLFWARVLRRANGVLRQAAAGYDPG
jgi:hypothetical protein